VQIYAEAAGATGSAILDVIGVARVEVSPDTATASPGGTQQYVATLYNDADSVITGPAVSWSSSAEAAGTIDAAGLATAVAAGDATITATAAGVAGTALLHVVNVARIEVVPDSASVNQGRTQDYDAILYDAYDEVVTGYEVVWSSGNEAIATVDQTGLATGLAGGVTTVIATSEGVSGTAIFEVVGIDRIEVTPAEATVDLEGTQQFEAVVYDVNDNVMEGYTVTWASANDAVATVDAAGLATGVANGEVRILAMAEGIEGSALLHVEGGSRIEVRPDTATVAPGGTAQFEAIQYDANGNVIPGDPVTWSSSNASVAIVDQNGRAIALTPGNAIIRATTGTLTGEATLTVAVAVTGGTVMAPMKSTWTSMTAEDVNDDGIVVGHLRGEGNRNYPFRWYSAGNGAIDYADIASVDTLPRGGAPNCWAYGIGDLGTIVGRCAYTTGGRAVYWRADGTGPVNMEGTGGFARGIYEGPDGTYVSGIASFAGLAVPVRVVRWSSLGAVPTAVNAPQVCPQQSIPDGMGYGINRDQRVVGDITVATIDAIQACRLVKRSFQRGLTGQITGTGAWYVPCSLQYAGDCGTSTARAINASGVVVGYMAYARTTYPSILTVSGAFYWVPGENPRAFIPGLPSYTDSGISHAEARTEAHGINDLGWAVGFYGATKAWLWRGPSGGPAETLDPFVPNTPASARAVSEPSPSGQYAGKVFVAGNGRTPDNKAGVIRWIIDP